MTSPEKLDSPSPYDSHMYPSFRYQLQPNISPTLEPSHGSAPLVPPPQAYGIHPTSAFMSPSSAYGWHLPPPYESVVSGYTQGFQSPPYAAFPPPPQYGQHVPPPIPPPTAASPTTCLPSETPLPPHLRLAWESPHGVHIYFHQRNDEFLTVDITPKLLVYKGPGQVSPHSAPPGCLSGCAQGASLLFLMHHTWRFGVRRDQPFFLRGCRGELAFWDVSTDPPRIVILCFPEGTDPQQRQKLDDLLKEELLWAQEQPDMVDKITGGVDSVYGSLKCTLNKTMKDLSPSVHKSTKGIRKFTGETIRMGGSFLSRGTQMLTDQFVEKEAPETLTQEQKELATALYNLRRTSNIVKLKTM